MERLELIAVKREKSSKGERKDLRKRGHIPAVVYGRNVDNTLLTVNWKELMQALSTSAGSNVLIDLIIKDNGDQRKETVMVREIQKHPIKDFYLHVDFIGISLLDKIQVNVPIYFAGEPEGVKEGGVISIQLREVLVESLPTAIPEQIEVDISGLNIGDSLNTGDLILPQGAELMDDPEETIVTVVMPTSFEEPAEEDIDEELEEGEEPVEGEEGEESKEEDKKA